MSADKKVSGDQFRYLMVPPDPAETMYPTTSIHAYHGQKEVGRLSLRGLNRERPTKKTPLEPPTEPGQLFNPDTDLMARSQIQGAFVHPDYQRQGIGTSMLNIAHQQFGTRPMHDTVVTKEAQAWAAKAGGPLHPEMNRSFTEQNAEPLSYTAHELRNTFERHYNVTYKERKTAGRAEVVRPPGAKP